MKKLMLGNEAIARGAYEAGVTVATAYPGTPSTEITETIAKFEGLHVEWAPNEKVAMEVACGASVSGARALCCMKHVGVNVAADPLFTMSYCGVNGGLVVVAADDPGMYSSQNEQDSRYYAMAAHIPMLEPSDSAEALEFTKIAFELSEKYDTPVMIRTTTRLSHSQSLVDEGERNSSVKKDYVKNVPKYVMMPAMAQKRHIEVEKRENKLAADANFSALNKLEVLDKNIGVICSGVVYQYVKEVMPTASVLKLGMVYPLPMNKIKEFAAQVEKLYVIEELEPIIEREIKAAGVECVGKEIFSIQGEITAKEIKKAIFGADAPTNTFGSPVRPPVMCAGCPHRSVFYVLNKLELAVCADIGCYTLGAQKPLSAIDTVLCMGASIGMAHGFIKGGYDPSKLVAVIGDSTFIHSGITGLIDTVYNKGMTTVMILDNRTTGMTGHQNHPGTGKTIRLEDTTELNIEEMCRACGVKRVTVVDAFDMTAVENALKIELAVKEPSVIITRHPCALLNKKATGSCSIDIAACKKCGMCMKIGCPAITRNEDGTVNINKSLCVGCGVCKQMCKFNAIV